MQGFPSPLLQRFCSAAEGRRLCEVRFSKVSYWCYGFCCSRSVGLYSGAVSVWRLKRRKGVGGSLTGLLVSMVPWRGMELGSSVLCPYAHPGWEVTEA